jgi:hypothetical protein
MFEEFSFELDASLWSLNVIFLSGFMNIYMTVFDPKCFSLS